MQSMQRIPAFLAILLGVSITVDAAPCKNHYILDEPCEIAALTWRPAANLLATHAREHTATRLADGRVLVVGGDPEGHYDPASDSFIVENLPASAEIYDPATDTWSWTGPMNLPRFGHAATLLGDGRVLVVGGGFLVVDGRIDWTNEAELRSSAEVYDPASNAWSVAGSLTLPRYGHTATLLPTGEVLVTGGAWFDEAVAASELFDPASGEWRVTSAPSEPRWGHTATGLPDGRVLIVGGLVEFWGDVQAQRAEVFDVATLTWSSAGRVVPRDLHTATSLQDGRVLIAGGLRSHAWRAFPGITVYDLTLDSTQIYDWRTGEWADAAPMKHPRYSHLAAPLFRNGVLLAGGTVGVTQAPSYRWGPVDGAEVFTDGAGWRDLVSPGEALRADSVTPLADGRLLFIFRNRAAILE